jgi:tRNA A-37 threonylcarbamoyl transferase component Bud32
VTPHTLGVEVEGGRFVRLIEKNSTIPAKQSRMFTTTEDNQDIVMVNVLQGESDRAAENRSLGRFSLSGVAGGRAGSARVQITFSINSDGLVEVSAEDVTTHVSRTVKLLVTGQEESPLRRKRSTEDQDEAGARRRRRSRSPRKSEAAPPAAPSEIQMTARRNDDSSRAKAPTSIGSAPVNLPKPAAGGQLSAARPTPLSSVPDPVHQPFAVPVSPQPFPASGRSALSVGDTGAGLVEGHGVISKPSQDPPTHIPDLSPVSGTAAERLSGVAVQDGAILPPAARRAIELIQAGDKSLQATEIYAEQADLLLAYSLANLGDQVTAAATAKILIVLGQQSSARRLLQAIGEGSKCDAGQLADLYELFLQRFPKDNEATSGFASSLISSGKVDETIERLEKMTAEENYTPGQIETLIQLYRGKLATSADDHNTQFKLVKLLIRTGKVDEAVNLLQRLVNVEAYRVRALKILGLCFWQKGLHYLAWQKFQQLPLNDEIKDILYRLSQDMEDTDQVLNAKVVLQHLVQNCPDYRDVSERLKRVEQMIRLEAGKPESNLTPSIFLTMKDSRFIILEEINRGSMGIVYRAKDKVLEEIVALKILNDYMTSDENAVERFKREARAAKRLAHPNIVRIHDMFEYSDKKILSMEYIEGRDLKKVLMEKKSLPDAEVARIGIDVASALGYAHGLSVVHRDIKPANIMITSDNRVKVTDFGIAKMLVGNDATRTGSQIIGTPLYMSPEQIRGMEIDARTDIYSLGATLYEAASGRPPFVDGNIEYHHLHTVPQSLPDTVSPLLANTIMKCLEKDPANRWPDTAALVRELKKVIGD